MWEFRRMDESFGFFPSQLITTTGLSGLNYTPTNSKKTNAFKVRLISRLNWLGFSLVICLLKGSDALLNIQSTLLMRCRWKQLWNRWSERLIEESTAVEIYSIHTGSKYIQVYSIQELIRRWDSERELFLRDIVHVESSAYAHWMDFLISTINIYARPNLCT